jgi:hypothetical protein
MKTTYSYVTLRYVHDVVTGEFANVGVVVYAPEQRLLEARFTGSYERLNALFLKIDHAHFRALMRYLTNRFEELGEDLRDSLDLLPVGGITQLVRQVLPPDDSSLQWSESGGGFTENVEETLRNLFSRLVERYVRESELPSRTDDEIARPFKVTLEKKHVAQRVRQKLIEARDYQYEFQFGWQNSVWHVYEPVSFDLMNPGSIVEKANTWLGRGMALQDSPEKFKIHFLLGEPKQPGTGKAFEHAQHLLRKIPGHPHLVRENQMTEFAEEVAEKISQHEDESAAVVREEPPGE